MQQGSGMNKNESIKIHIHVFNLNTFPRAMKIKTAKINGN